MVTAGGLIVPEKSAEKPSEGVVVAAGPGRLRDDGERVPMQAKAGDRVMFGKYAGTDVKLNGVDHLVMREDDILGIIRGVD